MALSKRAINPSYISQLLTNNFIAISLNYRLCPETCLIEGAMTDVRNAISWVRETLPILLLDEAQIDIDNIVIIGWSAGALLAMTTAWTTTETKIPAPRAILCISGLTDVEAGSACALSQYRLHNGSANYCAVLEAECGKTLPPPKMPMEEILKQVSRTPVSAHHSYPRQQASPRLTSQLRRQITSYESSHPRAHDLGWLRAGDARSELLLSVFKRGIGLPVLLKPLPTVEEIDDDSAIAEWLRAPPAERIEAINPMAHLRNGSYRVPTFFIHGDEDDIAPLKLAQEFHDALKVRGVETGFLHLRGHGHMWDAGLRFGSETWNEQVVPGYEFLRRMLERSKSS